MSEIYDALRTMSNALGEANDCSVVAVAAATGADYMDAYVRFARLGRTWRHGSRQIWLPAVVASLGYRMVDVTSSVKSRAKTVRTAARVLTRGTYILRIRGHVLCLKDGAVLDHTAGRLNRIVGAYRVVQI